MENNSWFAAVVFVFIIYSFLQLRFQIKLLQDPSYRVFQKLSLLSFWDFSKHLFSIWLANHALILLYSLLITYVGLKVGAWEKVSFVGLSLILIAYASLYFSYKTLQKFYPEKRVHRSRIILIKPYFLWFPFHLKDKKPLLFITVKATSLFFLSGFFYSYFSGGYDARWLAFGLLICSYFNYPLWLEKVEFGELQLYIFRNSPIPYFKKISQEFLIAIILIFPEILLLLYQGRLMRSNIEQFSLIGFWIGLNLGIYALCIFTKEKPKPSYFYFGFFAVFLAILFGINPIFLSLIFLLFYSYSIRSPYQL